MSSASVWIKRCNQFMQTTSYKKLKEFNDCEELAEWEKGRVLIEPIGIERQEAFRKMNNIRFKAKTTEDLVFACLIRDEFLCRYPGDIGMIRYGSHLIRSWEWMGGTFEDMQERLKEEHTRQTHLVLSSAA
jgi:hypothetical protein